jgi:hypothetical protein
MDSISGALLDWQLTLGKTISRSGTMRETARTDGALAGPS